ncbi:glycosyltransferase [Winogradskyella helgolandensis]|uniref:glycosyltransferase n=1 Tax=Winogradskyella helgolandensis TaxID=2697010 RepID=UPI0015BD4A65|nr:hypothetical protein [Winogradskyella helgolandensis]
MKRKIYIDPSADILYSSFYIKGLEDVYGKDSIKFSSRYFKKFIHDNHFFSFVYEHHNTTRKIVIDFTDSEDINSVALDWCDVYGKINPKTETLLMSSKIIPIGPSFGVQIYSLFKTVYLSLINFVKAYRRIPNVKRFFANYISQLGRPRFSSYLSVEEKRNYVFFVSSLWKKEKKTNDYRSHFISACLKIPNLLFEGGFAPRTHNDIKGYENMTMPSRISMTQYLDKMKASWVVFNTPAVKDCHGWKLAEFLCAGKVIISTPLSRVLPKQLNDKEHYLLTDGSIDDIECKLKLVLDDVNLHKSMKLASSNYFELELSPGSVIRKLTN